MSNTLLDLGASGIIKSGDVYTFTSYRGLYLHKKKENLSNFSFKYINNEISFADTDSYKIYLQDNKFFVKTPYFQGSLDNIEQKFLNEDAKLNI
ncbi:hypothetical protein FNJ88_05330 [Chryseobacterium sp. SNU WT5]|uniref:hypothetical protein n=1 Tax=Chryseobacterium sp. SNU WT5 TaxID=2594269 RepID=UPI00117FE923|nr:hypothetical protein [Chryseobacterium sp. SNU WT5]QDP85007.1 hypothetical protein FNJ88_05330 [Chryseobacterium sp. SNU WT5]